MKLERIGVALVGTMLLMSCSSYQAPAGELAPSSRVRLEALSSSPIVVGLRATDGSPTFQYCQARLIEGPVSTVIGDTVIFSRLDRVESATSGDLACISTGAARTVLQEERGHRLRVAQEDNRRTFGTVVLLGIAAAMLFGAF